MEKVANKRKVVISIGSNTPDREERMEKAITALANRFDDFRCSEVYETPCWRGEGPDYFNAVAVFTTTVSLSQLDETFKAMEVAAGRPADGPERRLHVPLDIDVVVYGNEVVRKRDFERYYFTKGYNEIMDPRNIEIQDYIYDLPEDRIAAHPLSDRDKCKLLVADKEGVIADTVFENIADYLPHDTLLIYNNTRVINARIRFTKPSGGVIEVFCLEPVLPADYQLNFSSSEPVEWKCLVGNSKRWKSGTLTMPLQINGKQVVLCAERIARDGADSVIRFVWDDNKMSFSEVIGAAGVIPIPPYLNRDTEVTDSEDYQTVYGRVEGSVAAPTAGLHFTEVLLDRLTDMGMQRRDVTLHVGAGTFQPVKSDTMADHPMHAELIDVSRNLIEELGETHRTVTAVGTTTVRTLESLYHIGCQMATGQWQGELDQWYPYEPNHPNLSVAEAMKAILTYLDVHGYDRLVTSTRIIIAPTYRFRVVNYLITNFHQPGSTLLLLVSAIVGDTWRQIYAHALESDYRFLSYGDACLLKITN